MNKDKPYSVANKDGKIKLVIMDAKEGLPAAFALMGTRAVSKKAIRVTGGCKGMSDQDKEQMLQYFSEATKGYQGVIWSGGTRMTTKDGKIDPMVTDIPGVIASRNPGCIALGTLPRTEMLTLQYDSRLVLDQWGTVPNPDLSGILIVQNGAEGSLDWDGDLDVYFRLMENWQNYGGFKEVGLISWNGGPITEKEIINSLKRGWTTILIKGSGRVTDEVIEKINSGEINIENGCAYIVSRDNSTALRQILIVCGFIEQV